MSVIQDAIGRDGRSLRRIGEAAGVDPTVVARFAKGERDVTTATADRLCKVLGLKLRLSRRRKARKGR